MRVPYHFIEVGLPLPRVVQDPVVGPVTKDDGIPVALDQHHGRFVPRPVQELFKDVAIDFDDRMRRDPTPLDVVRRPSGPEADFQDISTVLRHRVRARPVEVVEKQRGRTEVEQVEGNSAPEAGAT